MARRRRWASGEETVVILGVAMGAEVPVLLAGTTYVVDSAGASPAATGPRRPVAAGEAN